MESDPNADSDQDLDPSRDDLPLKANTNHMLVKHYVLDLTVHFDCEVNSGSIVLFLERPVSDSAGGPVVGAGGGCCHGEPRTSAAASEGVTIGWEEASWEDGGKDDGDFVLVLDCCDLAVQKVEEVDVASVPGMGALLAGRVKGHSGEALSTILVRALASMPSSRWKHQQDLYSQCSSAPAPPGGGALQFRTDRWSLQIRKRGVQTPHAFPLAVRIWYQTKPEGASVRWTKDQSDRRCVYTQGSPINNRALFPCQEPPVAMSTWQARVRAPSDYVVLLSGENEACPVPDETGFYRWDYYVTMPMPASTFTVAVGQWVEAKARSTSAAMTDPRTTMDVAGMNLSASCSLEQKFSSQDGEPDSLSVIQKPCSGVDSSGLASEEQTPYSDIDCSGLTNPEPCSHMDYPCRFPDATARAQAVIRHRVFAPPNLQQQTESMLLPLLPPCLAAAHSHLGVHPFLRLDVLIVPPGFSSLGMASRSVCLLRKNEAPRTLSPTCRHTPHMVFLSQSVLSGDSELCGARLCHEIAHAWFGLAIGARDWTEEWISEGFATYLEDVLWARVQQQKAGDGWQLKALLRWRRLKDELHTSEEELQILRPNRENTGEVSESGASVVKHALNPEKPFMQVHYLKGYFLLKFLASKIGEQEFLRFIHLFVNKYHGQLILSQDFLRMLFEKFPHVQSQGLTLEAVYSDWLDRPGIPELRSQKTLLGVSEGWFRCSLVEEVKEEVVKWIDFEGCGGRGAKRRRVGPKVNYRELTPEQLVLLLEFLLEEAELSVTSLRTLERVYGLRGRDAEVRHRWCELVVKHKHTAAYGDVEHFLMDDQMLFPLWLETSIGSTAVLESRKRLAGKATQVTQDKGESAKPAKHKYCRYVTAVSTAFRTGPAGNAIGHGPVHTQGRGRDDPLSMLRSGAAVSIKEDPAGVQLFPPPPPQKKKPEERTLETDCQTGSAGSWDSSEPQAGGGGPIPSTGGCPTAWIHPDTTFRKEPPPPTTSMSVVPQCIVRSTC
ncbi:hypothetical protein SKAU_G00015570 [Synaphobranchus kaupii]|uniref:Peptidase M1 leukotriene A4 hydrolase/aminopeptidase C-terminal domain-containing protein n=1 Tax=Synaphobranchus kaupii TaxID=118154 RepID=A0A9Q1GAY0_SYNKA|nr:hypothetical protein SKAU_G00015570 [Synaphobranchus kaupii]